MPCYHPLKGYRAKTVNPTGKRSIVFNPKEGFYDLPIDLPCGRCDGCKLERSRQWAVRLVHEGELHDDKVFLTLTYDNEKLPPDGSLNVEHFQNFMKRLRAAVNYEPTKFRTSPQSNIRFFHCGEYGESYSRPHYHACIFNLDFNDRVYYKGTLGNKLYTSDTLEKLWSHGFATIGEVTFESAAYVARYILKKHHGADAKILYEGRKPEYVTMSRRPGIGKPWLEKFKKDVKRDDMIVLRGVPMKPPKFYGNQFEIEDPKRWAQIKADRKNAAVENAANTTWEQLKAKAYITKQNIKQLTRSIENDEILRSLRLKSRRL